MKKTLSPHKDRLNGNTEKKIKTRLIIDSKQNECLEVWISFGTCFEYVSPNWISW